jgi:hypothetical protein
MFRKLLPSPSKVAKASKSTTKASKSTKSAKASKSTKSLKSQVVVRRNIAPSLEEAMESMYISPSQPSVASASALAEIESFYFPEMDGRCQGVKPLIDQVSSSLAKHQVPIGKCLGSGEMGKTFEVGDETSHLVIKIVRLPDKKWTTQFQREAALQRKLGELSVAPAVSSTWVENGYGFIVMERLKYMYRSEFFDLGDDEKVRDERSRMLQWVSTHTDQLEEHDLSYLNEDVDLAIVGALEVMIKNGYFHNDIHPGNIGFNAEGQIRLFDYGFTDEMHPGCVEDKCFSDNIKNQCLGFALYQIVEHFPLQVRNAFSTVYDIIYLIRRGEYRFGSNIAHFKKFRFNASAHQTQVDIIQQMMHGVNSRVKQKSRKSGKSGKSGKAGK